MASKSLSDIAFEILANTAEAIPFAGLWKQVSTAANLDEGMITKKVASFYNAIMMDSRFISLEGNTWDLRERHTLDSLQIDPELLEDMEDYDDEEFEEDFVVEEDEDK